MTQTASNYGTVLFELGVKKEIVEKTKEIFSLTEELPKMLQSPIVSNRCKASSHRRHFSGGDKKFSQGSQ